MSRSSWPILFVTFQNKTPERRARLWTLLEALGPTGVAGDLLQDAELQVFFASRTERDQARQSLQRAFPGELAAEPMDLPDEGWAERSQASLESIRVGRIVVSPPWDPRDDDGISIVIEPSMGFGTGHHQSTRLCLSALQAIAVGGRQVIDVGTGSGVLAIAALALGAGSVVALDTDSDALEAARRNLRLNGLEQRARLELCDVRRFTADPADVVLANLTGPLLMASRLELAGLTRREGHLIVSGLTTSDEGAVVAAFAPPARMVRCEREDDWVGLLFQLP